MDKFDENALKIANYLENRMNAEEEEAFMLELNSDDDLRNQYEDELSVSYILKERSENRFSESDVFLQPADDHIKMIETALEKQQKDKVPVINIFARYKNIAAVFFIVVFCSIIYFIASKKNSHEISQQQPGKDSIISNHQPVIAFHDSSKQAKDSHNRNKIIIDSQQLADSLYKKFYQRYSGTDDQVEVSYYYDKYRSKKYDEVLNTTDKDIQTMGANAKKNELQNYLKFYKGLSYLDEEKLSIAIDQFNAILKTAGKKSSLYYEAQWYSALSLLKKGDFVAVSDLLKQIALSSSPYKVKAGQLLQAVHF